MNYLKFIKEFWRRHEEHCFKPSQIALYFYLLEVCNKCLWKNPFKRNNHKIEADLNISYKTLHDSRKSLKEFGLIDFKTVNGNSNVMYTLVKFDEVSDEVDGEVLSTKDKQNEKSNKEKESIPNLKSFCGLTEKHARITSLFNRICTSFKPVIHISANRKEKIDLRLAEMKDLETMESVFKKAESSDFLKGHNKDGWKATFDWIFANPNNWIKILEGNYDNKSSNDSRFMGMLSKNKEIDDRW